MPRLALGWGSSVRSSVLLPAMTPNSGPPDVESPATPRLRRTGPAPTPSSVTQRASPVAGWACLAAVTSGPLPAADMGLDQLLRASFVRFVASCCTSFRSAEHRIPPGEPHPTELSCGDVELRVRDRRRR